MAGSSHDDGFGQRGSRRAPLGRPLTRLPRKSVTEAKPSAGDADLEFDPMLRPLELELEPTPLPIASGAVDPPPTLAPETPLPRCLTDAAYASSRPAPTASKIPPAPKLPRFSVPAGQAPRATHDEPPPNSETCLGLPTDRVLPGSPALVSTFRPKPQTRSGYSVTHTCQEERVYAPKRTGKAKPPSKRRR